MAKSKIIKDLISKKIELTQALERVLVIAMEINDADTIRWVKSEKNGYGKDDDVPDYRILSLSPIGTYQLLGNGGILMCKNHPLPTIGIPDDMREYISRHTFKKGISQVLEQYIVCQKDGTNMVMSIPPEMYACFEEGTNIIVTNAHLAISPFDLERIIDAVRTRTIELLVLLEKNFGVLDDLDIDLDDYESNEIKRLQEACSLVIKGDNNGDTYIITNSKVKKSNIGKGNSSNKESKVEISPEFNGEKEKRKSIWEKILGLFGGKSNG